MSKMYHYRLVLSRRPVHNTMNSYVVCGRIRIDVDVGQPGLGSCRGRSHYRGDICSVGVQEFGTMKDGGGGILTEGRWGYRNEIGNKQAKTLRCANANVKYTPLTRIRNTRAVTRTTQELTPTKGEMIGDRLW